MVTFKKTIVLEDVFDDIFQQLPEITSVDGSGKYKVVFDYGDEKALNNYLANREQNKPYPLIWMLYPYLENHSKNNLVVDRVELILAMETNTSMENRERISTSFGKVLLPLLDNIRKAFQQANVVNVSGDYDVVKHPNYSKTDIKDENAVISLWDALKISFNIKVIDTCLRPLKF